MASLSAISALATVVMGAALLGMIETSACDVGTFRDRTCASGALTDDGARLDGSLGGDGDANVIELEGDGRGPDKPTGFFCARRALGVCEFEFSNPPTPGALTLADIASFRADAGTLSTEPNGWAAIGLPFNPISTAATHEVEGVLLGAPATVRFTPVAWRWDFGDGSEPTATATGGASWAALGVPEFEPTTTSHIYRARGQYAVAAVVTFVADYRIGAGPWARIPGRLELTVSAPAAVRVVNARTVLVAEDCNANPRGPGC